MPIRVVLGDDSLLVREGLRQLLEAIPRSKWSRPWATSSRCARPASASGPTSWSPTSGCRRRRPTRGSGSRGELRERHPEIGVVVLSQFADPVYALALLERGSARRAYLLKERVHNRAELTAAIQAVAPAARWSTRRSSRRWSRAQPAPSARR